LTSQENTFDHQIPHGTNDKKILITVSMLKLSKLQKFILLDALQRRDRHEQFAQEYKSEQAKKDRRLVTKREAQDLSDSSKSR
jgi:hypothetical protein